MAENPTSHAVCSLSWNLEKVQKILNNYEKCSKEEKTKFISFLEHCSIDGEIFTTLITTELAETFFVFICKNPTLTPTQLSRLLYSIEEKEELSRKLIFLYDLAEHPQLNSKQLLQISIIVKKKARASSLPGIFSILMKHHSYNINIHKEIFLKGYTNNISDVGLLRSIIDYNKKHI